MTREPRIVIIGAGVAGIATAVTLQRAGFHDFTILEKGADVGGVWHWNRYPGLTCDVAVTALPILVRAQTGLDRNIRHGRRDSALSPRGRRTVRSRRSDSLELRSRVDCLRLSPHGRSPPPTAQSWKRIS